MEGENIMTTHTTHKHTIRARIHRFGETCLHHKPRAKEHAEHTQHSTLDHITLAAIIASIAIMIWGFIDPEHKEIVEVLDYVILVYFGVEIGIRIHRAGRGWYKDPWLWLDLIIIVVALLPLGSDAIAARLVRAARLAHVGRHLPHLRHLPALLRVVRAARIAHVGRHLPHLKEAAVVRAVIRRF
jgi:hypothetical protein